MGAGQGFQVSKGLPSQRSRADFFSVLSQMWTISTGSATPIAKTCVYTVRLLSALPALPSTFDRCPYAVPRRLDASVQARRTGPGPLISLQRRCPQSFQSHAWVSTSHGMAWLARTGLPLWRCTRTHGFTPYLSTMPPNWTRHPGEESIYLLPGCIECLLIMPIESPAISDVRMVP